MPVDKIEIERITVTAGTQMRAVIDQSTVAEYAEAAKNKVILPPLDVFTDGAEYWLADGFHRYWAAKKNEAKKVRANVHKGGLRDAILFAVGANVSHGLKRTNADKRRAVEALLKDEEWAKLSDRAIAEHASVGRPMVAEIRADLELSQVAEQPPEQVQGVCTSTEETGDSEPAKRVGKDGKVYPAKPKPAKPASGKPAPKQKKSGSQTVTVAQRKEALSLFGKLVRALDKLGIAKLTDPHMEAIEKAIKSVQ